MLQIPPNGYPTTEQNLQSHQIQKAKTTNNLVSSGQSDLYEFQNFRKKLGFQSFQDFKSSETRGAGNSEEKCFPPQVPGQNYKKKKSLVVPQSQERDQ